MKIPNLLHDPMLSVNSAESDGITPPKGLQRQDMNQYAARKLEVQMNAGWQNFFTQLVQQLQANVGEQGFVIPQQKTDVINAMQATSVKQTGLLVYDNQTHELKININGAFKVVQVV